MTSLLAFHLTHQPNPKSIKDRYGNSPTRSVIDLQKQFFQLLLREPITLSLRYISDPNAAADQRLQIFLLINTELTTQTEQEQLKRRLLSTIQSSEFYQIYPFQEIELNAHQFPTLQNLDWVNALLEIPKAETISPKGYYLPRLFPENQDHDMVKICEQLSRIRSERFLLEITLQPHNNPPERQKALDAIETLLKAQSKSSNSAKDAILDTVVKSAQNHQNNYSHQPLFTHSIKLLAEQEQSLSNLAITWLQNATNSDYANLYHNLPIIKRGSPEFQKSLQATRDVRISPQSSHHSPALQAWQQQFGSQSISKIFGSKPMFGDGSTSYSNPTPPPQSPQSFVNPTTSSNIVSSSGSHALAKPMAIQGWDRPQQSAVTMQDLLPLRHLVTLDEVSSFLRVVIPQNKLAGMAVAQTTYPTMTAEEIFNTYRHLITPDQYIVGLDDEGNPITSSWDEIPHRLVAGETGWGKTNFMQWVIFQFSYANPEAKIYIMDFKKLDFPDLKNILPHLNWDIITKVEEALEMIDKIDEEQESRLQLIMQYPGARSLSHLIKRGVSINRTLWIIDEAAAVGRASSRLSDKIENKLAEYAQIGRSFGIHMIYGAQRPDTSIVSKQVVDQLGEKTVFKVTYNASMAVLETGEAEHINTKGRAILHRGGSNWSFVNTPEMPDLFEQPLATTIWGNI
jgi:hypothetical protein